MCLSSMRPLLRCKGRAYGNSRQTGVGLPMALFIIIVLALLALAITELETSTATGASMSVLSTRAFYAAESQAQVALVELFPPGQAERNCSAVTRRFVFPTSNSGLAYCTARVSCLENVVAGETYFSITSTGTCGYHRDPDPAKAHIIPKDAAQRRVEVRAH